MDRGRQLSITQPISGDGGSASSSCALNDSAHGLFGQTARGGQKTLPPQPMVGGDRSDPDATAAAHWTEFASSASHSRSEASSALHSQSEASSVSHSQSEASSASHSQSVGAVAAGGMGSGVRAATEVSHRTSRASSAAHIQSEALTITASHRGDSAYGQEQGHQQGHHHQPPQHQHGRGDAAGGTGRHHPLAAAAAVAHGGHHAGGGGYMSYQKGIFKMDGQPTGVEVDVAVHVVAQVRPAVARRQAATLTARRRSSETGRPLFPASAPAITAAPVFAGAPTVSPQARVESDWDVRNDAVASLGGGGGGFGSIGGSFGGAIDHRAAGGYGGGTDVFRGLTVASCAISADPR